MKRYFVLVISIFVFAVASAQDVVSEAINEVSKSQYTDAILLIGGFIGVLIHNLIKMDKINRGVEGNFNYWQYFKLEKFSIILSVLFIIACVIGKNEVSELEYVGKWLFFAFVAGGYMAQSIIVSVTGGAEKKLAKVTDLLQEKTTNENNGA